MTDPGAPVIRSYPREITVGEDRTVRLRLMEKSDRDRMTTEQKRTRARLERLGFRVDGILRGYVRDREGKRRDLLVMSAGVGRLTDTVQMGLWRRP